MGNTHKSIEEPELQYIRKIRMLHFGEVELYYDNTNKKQLFRKEFNFLLEGESSKVFLEKIKKFNTRSNHLVQLFYLVEGTGRSSEICNQINMIVAYFEYFPLTLRLLIDQRRNANQQFSEKHIWKFLRDLLQAECALNLNDNYHGDISPEFIYYDQEKDALKLFDPVFFNTHKSGYHRALLEPAFLSPEILINLQQKRAIPQYNPYKSDVFSIGMVILYCMTMMNPIVAYDLTKYQLDFYYIQNSFRIASKKYSEWLITVVRNMLMEKSRPTAKQLLHELGYEHN